MEDGALELKKYTRLLRNWWWFLVLGAVVAGASAYVITIVRAPVYNSTVRIIVERTLQPGVLSTDDIITSERLARTYVQLVKVRPILQEVASKLPVSYEPAKLARKLKVSNVLDTGEISNIIKITATANEPVLAALIANTTADTFINGLLDRQLSQLARYQEIFTQYGIQQDANTLGYQAASVGVLSVVEPALPPTQPSNRGLLNTLIIIAVGVTLGLGITGLAVVLRDYLDDRFRSPDELRTVAGLAPLALIPRYRGRDGLRIDSLGPSNRLGPFVESYRFLSAALELASRDQRDQKQSQTLLVTAPGISEGKTTTSANLAITAAREGKSTILVDSDLRSPSLHRVFGLSGQIGLSQILTGDATLDETLASTSIEGLRILPSGALIAEPGVALASPKMNTIIEQLKEQADLVIFDSSSLLAVTDSMLLASLVDGVLLIVDASRSSREAVQQATDRLRQIDAHIVGGVLNKVSGGGQADRYHRHYRKYFEKSNENGAAPQLPVRPMN